MDRRQGRYVVAAVFVIMALVAFHLSSVAAERGRAAHASCVQSGRGGFLGGDCFMVGAFDGIAEATASVPFLSIAGVILVVPPLVRELRKLRRPPRRQKAKGKRREVDSPEIRRPDEEISRIERELDELTRA